MTPRFTLRQLEIFEAVARHGGISKAAADLYSSPSAVSSALKALEESLGHTLCIRHKSHGVRLTAAGHTLRKEANALLKKSAEIQNVLNEDPADLRGTIRLGCYSSIASTLLPQLLSEFISEHPHVEFELVEGNQTELQLGITHGEIDLALIYNRISSSDISTATVIKRDPYALVSATHPLAHKEVISLRELENFPLILLDLPPSKENTLSWCQEAQIQPHIRWVTTDLELTKSLVGQNLGYSLLLQPLHSRFTADGSKIKALKISPSLTPVPIHLAWSNTLPLMTRVESFLRFAQDNLAHAK